MESADGAGQPGRRWGPAIALFVLGLAVAGVTNAPGLQGDPGPTLRAVGSVGWVAGLIVSGLGVHRMLWRPRSPRPPAVRILVTAIVSLPAFVAAGILLSVLMTLIQLRSPF
jgi:cytochrome b561